MANNEHDEPEFDDETPDEEDEIPEEPEDENYMPGETEAVELLKHRIKEIEAVESDGKILLSCDGVVHESMEDLKNYLVEEASTEWTGYAPRDDGDWAFEEPDWFNMVQELLFESPTAMAAIKKAG